MAMDGILRVVALATVCQLLLLIGAVVNGVRIRSMPLRRPNTFLDMRFDGSFRQPFALLSSRVTTPDVDGNSIGSGIQSRGYIGTHSSSRIWEALDQSMMPLAVKITNYYAAKQQLEQKIDLNWIADNLLEWRRSLQRGIVPENIQWPREPLHHHIVDLFLEKGLPSLTARHPELISDILLGLMEISIDFEERSLAAERTHDAATADPENDMDSMSEVEYWEEFGQHSDEDTSIVEVDLNASIEEAAAACTQQLSEEFQMLDALQILDDLYGGYNHHLMKGSQQQIVLGSDSCGLGAASADEGTASSSNLDSGRGFGLHDGIWRHTGWRHCREVQGLLDKMVELKLLIRQLGYRADIDGRDVRKFHPTYERLHAPLGVVQDSLIPNEIRSIYRSQSLQGLLGSEALLLAGTTHVEHDGSGEINQTNAARRRRMFLAKWAGKQLMTYEPVGWINRPVSPKRQKKHRAMQRLPTKSGGPIIICLDTSWSMAGGREQLAKAVVLQSVVMATRQQRRCFVIAFSGKGNTVSCELGLNSATLRQLLHFLSMSFHGGTDVIAPMRQAIELMKSNPEWHNADIILVTDGELRNPPVDADTLSELRDLERDRGCEIHGLLVGRNRSDPLNMLCVDENSSCVDVEDRVHNFLCKYDPLLQLQQEHLVKESPTAATAAAESVGIFPSSSTALFAIPVGNFDIKENKYQYHHYRGHQPLLRAHPRLKALRMTATSRESDNVFEDIGIIDPVRREAAQTSWISNMTSSVRQQVLMRSNDEVIIRKAERSRMREAIMLGMSAISDGLVERELEVQLLFLAALCKEHILLIGPPGTGKSELGRRLAALYPQQSNGTDGSDSGHFFERLLTRYTSPEELFGPLSLKALENDEYCRLTDGYLPTCSVAFLDEIFKANSAILNSLLTILNERKFDNGRKRQDVPLVLVIGASNELPDGDELDALYDRFLFRRCVQPISDDAIDSLFAASKTSFPVDTAAAATETILSPQFREDVYIRSADEVTVPIEVQLLLRDVRKFLRDEVDPAVYISDRRLMKSVQMLKVAAFTNGREEVSLIDCLLLTHVLWSDPEEIPVIEKWLWEHIVPEGGIAGLDFLLNSIYKRVISVAKLRLSAEERQKEEQYQHLQNEFSTLVPLLKDKLQFYNQLTYQLLGSNEASDGAPDHVWLTADQCRRAQQQLVPKAKRYATKVQEMLMILLQMEAVAMAVPDEHRIVFNENQNALHPDSMYSITEQLWERYQHHNSGSEAAELLDGMAAEAAEDDAELSDEEIGYSRKEAQRKLSAEHFKMWKRAQKKASKKQRAKQEE